MWTAAQLSQVGTWQHGSLHAQAWPARRWNADMNGSHSCKHLTMQESHSRKFFLNASFGNFIFGRIGCGNVSHFCFKQSVTTGAWA